jgi:hypothetical protein
LWWCVLWWCVLWWCVLWSGGLRVAQVMWCDCLWANVCWFGMLGHMNIKFVCMAMNPTFKSNQEFFFTTLQVPTFFKADPPHYCLMPSQICCEDP